MAQDKPEMRRRVLEKLHGGPCEVSDLLEVPAVGDVIIEIPEYGGQGDSVIAYIFSIAATPDGVELPPDHKFVTAQWRDGRSWLNTTYVAAFTVRDDVLRGFVRDNYTRHGCHPAKHNALPFDDDTLLRERYLRAKTDSQICNWDIVQRMLNYDAIQDHSLNRWQL